MLKVLIADDEARFLNLILMLVDWKDLGMEVVATASNGIEALEMVKTYKPNILITDIRMPGLNGLELISKVKEESPDIEIAIVSGYAHFDYAQTAIKFNVVDYLLKPIKQDELIITLEKLGECCKKRMKSNALEQKFKESSDNNAIILKNKLISDLRDKKLSKDSIRLSSNYSFNYEDGSLLRCFILKADYDFDVCSKLSVRNMQRNAESMLLATLNKYVDDIAVLSWDSICFGIISFREEDQAKIRKILHETFTIIKTRQSLLGGVILTMSLSDIAYRESDIIDSYKTVYETMQERVVSSSSFLEYRSREADIYEPSMLDKYKKQLEKALETYETEQFDIAVSMLEEEIIKKIDISGSFLMEIIIKSAGLFAILMGIENSEQELKDFEDRCNVCNDVSSIFVCLREFQRKQFNAILEKTQNESIKPIRLAKKYIQDNYNKPISLEDVSYATGFSVNYFSSIFKKHAGEGFAKYLIRVRIDNAKTLLKETDMNIASICTDVGYSDITHFNQTFKKITGLSPSQYRKLNS